MIELSGPNTQIIFGYSTRNKPEEIKFFETVAESFAIEKVMLEIIISFFVCDLI